MVGMTELMNFRKIISAIWGLIFLPLALDSSTNLFSTSECLQGWMVSMRIYKQGISSSVTVQFWYSAQKSQNICLELRGVPLKSLPLSQSLGVWQYSSQVMYTLQFLNYYSLQSAASSPSTCRKPSFISSLIYSLAILLMRPRDDALVTRNCLLGLSRYLFGLARDFCHFHPKLVNCSAACMNCSGDSTPFASKSLSVGVNLELMKFLTDPIIILYQTTQVGHLLCSPSQSAGMNIEITENFIRTAFENSTLCYRRCDVAANNQQYKYYQCLNDCNFKVVKGLAYISRNFEQELTRSQ